MSEKRTTNDSKIRGGVNTANANTDLPPAKKTIEDPPEYNAKQGSDWLGGPQNGSEIPKQSSDWLGGPQNGSEVPNSSVSPETTTEEGVRGQLKWK